MSMICSLIKLKLGQETLPFALVSNFPSSQLTPKAPCNGRSAGALFQLLSYVTQYGKADFEICSGDGELT